MRRTYITGLRRAQELVAEMRAQYPEDIWPDQQNGSTDRAGAKMVRLTCDNVVRALEIEISLAVQNKITLERLIK